MVAEVAVYTPVRIENVEKPPFIHHTAVRRQLNDHVTDAADFLSIGALHIAARHTEQIVAVLRLIHGV